jgi:hypothetical protein
LGFSLGVTGVVEAEDVEKILLIDELVVVLDSRVVGVVGQSSIDSCFITRRLIAHSDAGQR